MSAIKDSNQQPALGIRCPGNKIKGLTMIIFIPALKALLFVSFLVACLVLTGVPAAAIDLMPSKFIAQITMDDDAHDLRYPVAVTFDPVMEEIYLVDGISGRVVVYGPDFFPRASIGAGRSILAPRGVTVIDNGEVYVSQIRNYKNPAARITILNGAFFVDREIFLDQIKEAAAFIPKKLAVSSDGLIYLAGDNNRGVLVLDNEGNFLRWLKPMDQIYSYASPEKEEKEQEEQEQLPAGEAEEPAPDDDIWANIPEEFRPSGSSDEGTSVRQLIRGAAKINFVHIDSSGKLYLISAETGKIYVYGPDEDLLFSFGQKGGSPGQLSQPRSLTIDEEQGVIYVVDYQRHTILGYDMNGEFLFETGGRGTTPGWYNFPSDLAINNYGQLIVADLLNNRIQILDIGAEAISRFVNKPSSDILPESPDNENLTDQNELSPVQADTLGDQEDEGDVSLEEIAALIREEINQEESTQGAEPAVEPLPETSGAVEAEEPDEPAAGQPEKPDEVAVIQDVEPAVQPEVPAEPPDLAGVDGFIGSWVEAWEEQNIEKYLSHYSIDFITPGGISITAWEKQRHQSLGRPKFIKIDIRDMQKEKVNDTRARVTFIQGYQSDTYSDEVVKTLDLIWEFGGWKIEREESRTY